MCLPYSLRNIHESSEMSLQSACAKVLEIWTRHSKIVLCKVVESWSTIIRIRARAGRFIEVPVMQSPDCGPEWLTCP